MERAGRRGGEVAVLCGDLNMLRCFAGTDIPRVVVSSDPADPTLRSRHCGRRAIIADPLVDPEKTVRDLLDLGRALPGRPILYYGDDAMLLLVSRHREALGRVYSFLMPEADRVEDLVDKTRFGALAEGLGIPIPRTVRSTEMRGARAVRERLGLPVILKPNFHLGWFESQAIRREGGRPQKILRADTWEVFDRLYERIASFTSEFIVQEYIPGGTDSLWSFHAYADRDGAILGAFVGRKIRTWPREWGVSTFLELVKDDALARLGADIVRRLGIVGPVKLDFKRDPATGRTCLLEVNSRFNLWHYLGAVSGVNIPLLAWGDLSGRPLPRPSGYATGTRWVSFAQDLKSFLQDYRPAGEFGWASWIGSFRGRVIFDTFAWDDPRPLAFYLWRHLRRLVADRAAAAIAAA